MGNDSKAMHSQSLADDILDTQDLERAAAKKNQRKQSLKRARTVLAASSGIYKNKKQRSLEKKLAKQGIVTTISKKNKNHKVPPADKHRHHHYDDSAGDDDDDDEATLDPVLDTAMSKKVLKQARSQRLEEQERVAADGEAVTTGHSERLETSAAAPFLRLQQHQHLQDSDDEAIMDATTVGKKKWPGAQGTSVGPGVGGGHHDDHDNYDHDLGDDDLDEDEDLIDYEEITAEQEQVMALFANQANQAPRKTLTDIILEKIQQNQDQAMHEGDQQLDQLPPESLENQVEQKVRDLYTDVAQVMHTYTSGRVPKAFKIIPSFQNWQEIMWITRPDEWSPSAVFVATRLFASNLNANMAQTFYSQVLLPRCREDIAQNKKLNFHLYQSLKKAVYKPQAFFKGLIFPLLDQGCTFQEGVIFASVLVRVSIPVLHSAAALLRISQMPYSGPSSLLIHALLDKKYALPYRVLDALVLHYMKMLHEKRVLPVVWHKSLLIFAQRYKTEITRAQKDELKALMKVQFHHQITPEIRRELYSTRSRGEFVDPDANTIAMDIADATT